MKKKEKLSLRSMKIDELKKILIEAQKDIAKKRVIRHTTQSKNVQDLSAIKRKIAVLETFIREKELSHE